MIHVRRRTQAADRRLLAVAVVTAVVAVCGACGSQGASSRSPSALSASHSSQATAGASAKGQGFVTDDGKIRCYSPLAGSGVRQSQTGTWCFADNHGPHGADCHFAPGPTAMQLPRNGAVQMYPCSAEDIKEATLRPSHLAIMPNGSIQLVGASTCHVSASGTSVVCGGGPHRLGFEISSSEGSLGELLHGCQVTRRSVRCIDPSGQSIS